MGALLLRARLAQTPARAPDGSPRTALAVFAGFALLYGLTWNGRYLHDGPLFLWSMEEGQWLHFHAAYLPCAHALRLLLGWLPGFDGADSLALLAVLSGAAMAALSFSLCARLGCDAAVALAAAALAGFAPVVWSAAGMVEIHVFGGAGACAAAWMAVALPLRPIYKVALAAAVALGAHLTNALMLPLLVALSFESHQGPRRARELWLALAGAAAVAVAMRALCGALLPEVTLSGTLGAVPARVAAAAAEPARFAGRLRDEYALPWLFLGLGPLCALLPGGRVLPWTRAAAAATGILGALLAAGYVPLGGQYGLVLCPALVTGTAQALSAPGPGKARALLLSTLAAATVLLALPQRAKLAHDPDREWAQALGPFLDETDVVLCLGRARKLRVEEQSRARAFDLMLAGQPGDGDVEAAVQAALEQQRANGGDLFLDPLVLSDGPRFAPLRPVISALESKLELAPLDGAPLFAARLP